MTTNLPVLYRALVPGDQPWMWLGWKDTWLGSGMCHGMRTRVYKVEIEDYVKSIISHPKVLTVVACNPESPDHTYGYVVGSAVGDTAVIHYVYVKPSLRRHGLGTEMVQHFCQDLRQDFAWYTHRSKHLPKDCKLLTNWLYNPFLLRRMLWED